MLLTEAWSKRKDWREDYYIPAYDRDAVKINTAKAPVWLHFGAGNIFRALIAAIMDQLIETGKTNKGIIVCEDFDKELISQAYKPYDSLSLLVTLRADGSVGKKVIGSVTEAVTETERMKALFCKPSIQVVSFTITEKGYFGLLMRKIAELCLVRYQNGAYPMALLSLDNCAHNGELLSKAVLGQAEALAAEGAADEGFLQYLRDETRITFPWSMIDKITPRPDTSVRQLLEADGFLDTEQIITKCNTYTAPFVNAEETQYLVIEDKFPNGRPPLWEAGVLLTDRDSVDRAEKMKVGTCLNPLHTALAIFGCLLGYRTIPDEMKDEQLNRLVWRLGYQEGIPAVIHPGIMEPEKFLKEVLTKRLPNPFMPDTPQRIATDTSQKLPVRFGQTLRAYIQRPELHIEDLVYIPLVFAGWLRYLMGIDDEGKEFTLSTDPRLEELKTKLQEIELGKETWNTEGIDRILSDTSIFGVDLFACGLAEKVKTMFREMIAGPGAVRKALQRYCR